MRLARVLLLALLAGPARAAMMIPDTGGLGVANIQQTEALVTADTMRCGAFIASRSMTNANGFAFYVAVGSTPVTVGICLYNADHSLLRASGVLSCAVNSGTACTASVSNFQIAKGSKYFLCWTSADPAMRMVSAGSYDEAIANAFVTNHGTGTSANPSGTCPDPMGSLTPTFGDTQLPYVMLIGGED